MATTRATTTAPRFLYTLFHDVMPISRGELRRWTTMAMAIPDATLREQALSSLTHKRFHADGGTVYAAARTDVAGPLVRLIVAYQTISDYLDNLCDRCESYDQQDFHQLHHAMRDAIEPDAPLRDYYHFRETKDDGGYLAELVKTCQSVIRQLPGYSAVLPSVRWFANRYCELQEIKHIEPVYRVDTLRRWWTPYEADFPDITWWEFAAATGSTLAVFALFLVAADAVSPTTEAAIRQGYFPWVCGLHILLDYLIDLEEDEREGDFNFVACYPSVTEARKRIREFATRSLTLARQLRPIGGIHRFVVLGLLGMYLSDGKVRAQKQVRKARRMVWTFGPTTWMFYGACKFYRAVR